MENETQQKQTDRIVRIMSKDIEGKMNVFAGLTKIKGISWNISNAICKKLKLDKRKKIGNLTDKEIEKITEFIKNPDLPRYIKNRKKDFESGEDKHITGTTLELQTEFDIKRLKKIKSYRGLRHLSGQPTRGQRTKAHFRKNRRKGTGIKKKAAVKKPIER